MNIVVTPTLPNPAAGGSGAAPVSAAADPQATPQIISAPPTPEQTGPSAPTAGAAPSGPAKRNYPTPAEVPTQQTAKGILFDFNDGCRVVVPEAEHPWRVRLSDLDTGNILFETELKAGRVNSTKRYYRALSARDLAAGRERASPTTIPPRIATSWCSSRSERSAIPSAGFPMR